MPKKKAAKRVAKNAAPRKRATAKKAAAKKVYTIDSSFIQKRIVEEIDWGKVNSGAKIAIRTGSSTFEGRIFKDSDNDIIICHNVARFDNYYNGLMGYKYSICLGKGTDSEFKEENMTVISLTPDPTFKIPPTIVVGNDIVEFRKGSIKVGCTTVSNALVREIAEYLKEN